MSRALHLAVRTPEGLVFEGEVRAIRADDLDGSFGILPGRRDLAAVLPPSLLLFTDAEGDGFIALGGGVLELSDGRCRVMTGDAQLARDPEEAAAKLTAVRAARRSRAAARREVFDDLEREAVRRLGRALAEGA